MRRWLNGLLSLGLLAALGLLALRLEGWRQSELRGSGVVVDGDTLKVAGTTVRLEGLDAPELRQTCERAGQSYPCGEEAQAALRRLIDGAEVQCTSEGRDRYRRVLGRCRAGEGDLGEALVSQGHAVLYGRSRRYLLAETGARLAGRGLWGGRFERPADWRKARAPRRGDALDFENEP